MSEKRLEKILQKLGRLLLSAAVGAVVCALITMLCSCRTVKYVPVEHTTYRTINRTDTVRAVDSVIFRDTVSYATVGDTVVKTQIKWRITQRNVYKAHVDTVNHTDTIVKTVKAENAAGKKVTARQSFAKRVLHAFQWLCFGIVLGIILNRYGKKIFNYFIHS